MNDKRAMLRHFLAALAYRTQKALRDAPVSFGGFQAGEQVRQPADLIRHMTSVMGYARTVFEGGRYRAEPLSDLSAEIARFHAMLEDLAKHLEVGTELRWTTEERMLQGPFADAMTHAGQLAMLRRLAGSPVRPENFIEAAIDSGNMGPRQPDPVSPKIDWPEAPLGLVPQSPQTNTPALVEAFYQRIWNAGELDAAQTLLKEDFSFRGSLGNELYGRSAFTDYVREVRTALADYQCEILACVSQREQAFAKMRFSGRHVSTLRGYAPTGKRVEWLGAALFRVEGPLIAQLWVLGDLAGLDSVLEANQA